jgi:cytochrome b
MWLRGLAGVAGLKPALHGILTFTVEPTAPERLLGTLRGFADMTPTSNPLPKSDLDDVTRLVHLGLTCFGLLAFFTGLWAGDYKKVHHLGFSLHKWLGLAVCFFIFFRLWLGFFGERGTQFSQWIPYTRDRALMVLEDLVNLLRLRLPDRPTHQGLAGVVQIFGLAVFAWMALTGTLMFFFLQPGGKARGMMHLIKELHEIGLWLIPIFLGIHVGAVTLHALAGNQVWRQVFFLEKKKD